MTTKEAPKTIWSDRPVKPIPTKSLEELKAHWVTQESRFGQAPDFSTTEDGGLIVTIDCGRDRREYEYDPKGRLTEAIELDDYGVKSTTFITYNDQGYMASLDYRVRNGCGHFMEKEFTTDRNGQTIIKSENWYQIICDRNLKIIDSIKTE